ncbi:MAG: hypothetical protein WB557_11080, partial [Solirubrobacteraceae bacterium]
SEQYAGLLLLPQPASAISAPAATVASAVRIATRPIGRLDPPTFFPGSIASGYAGGAAQRISQKG